MSDETQDQPLAIMPGSKVSMHYSILLEDGTVADESPADEPLEFVMGDESLIEGLELALYGLKVGDSQRLKISAENGFGLADEANIHQMQHDEFSMEIKPGMIIAFSTPSGEELLGAIREINGDEVQVDFNHPLAGREITFEVKILTVEVGDRIELQ